MDTINRIPRPLGTTYLSQEYQKDKSKENKQRLRRHILMAFIQQQLFLPYQIQTNLLDKAKGVKELSKWGKGSNTSSKPTSSKKQEINIDNRISNIEVRNIKLLDVSIGLGLSLAKTQAKIENLLAKQSKGYMEKTNYREMNEIATRAQISGLIFEALGNGQVHSQWAEELRAVARINGYNGLQTKEANSAMGNQLSQMKMAFDMLQKMLPQLKAPAINQNTQVNIGNIPHSDEHGQYLTATQASMMLEEKGISSKPLDLEALKAIHLSEPGIPDVKALPSDAQGTLNLDPKDLAFIKHEDRRLEELNIIGTQADVKPKKKKPITIKI